MAGLVTHLTDRLAPSDEVNADGSEKKKMFHTSTLDKINDFMNVFNARNLAEDDQLKNLVDQAKALTAGVSPEVLRSNDTVRASVAEGFTKIKSELDKLLVDAPIRSISFDE